MVTLYLTLPSLRAMPGASSSDDIVMEIKLKNETVVLCIGIPSLLLRTLASEHHQIVTATLQLHNARPGSARA